MRGFVRIGLPALPPRIYLMPMPRRDVGGVSPPPEPCAVQLAHDNRCKIRAEGVADGKTTSSMATGRLTRFRSPIPVLGPL